MALISLEIRGQRFTSMMKKEMSHPFLRVMEKIPLPYWISSLLVSIIPLLGFVMIGLSTHELTIAIQTNIIYIQLGVSAAILYGLLALRYFYKNFSEHIFNIRKLFSLNDEEFNSFYRKTFASMGDKWMVITILPLIVCSIFFMYTIIFPHVPDELFPFKSTSILFLYVSLFEFTLLCLGFLGAGFWIGIRLIQTFRKMSSLLSYKINPFAPNTELIPISRFVFASCFIILIALMIFYPAAIYILYVYGPTSYGYILGAGGVTFELIMIIIFYILPQYYIHLGMERVKNNNLSEIGKKITDYKELIDKENKTEKIKYNMVLLEERFINYYVEIKKANRLVN